ncbi:Nif3-like dinuclear metal center hexameric protein, partial [Enterococcus lactis]
ERDFVKTHEIHYKQLAVYVPVDHAQKRREALAAPGGGTQGHYPRTRFTSIGHGRFTPNVGAKPAIGKVGNAEQVQVAKVEVILPETIEKQVSDAMQS